MNRSADLLIGPALASESNEPIGRSALPSRFRGSTRELLVGGILSRGKNPPRQPGFLKRHQGRTDKTKRRGLATTPGVFKMVEVYFLPFFAGAPLVGTVAMVCRMRLAIL